MAKTDKIIKQIEKFAPLETAQEWDNSGWQINLGLKETKKVLLALDITENTVKQAIDNKCNLIISHHPLFFTPIKSISSPYIIKAIQNNIQIYSAHTNLDIAKGGVSEKLAEKCGFKNTSEIYQFIRLAKLKQSQDFTLLVDKIKNNFDVKSLKITNPNRKTFKSIAFCSGAGAQFIEQLERLNIDIFVTGDVKHHDALYANNITVIDLGHFHSEKYVVEIFKDIIKNEDVEIIETDEKQAWELI